MAVLPLLWGHCRYRFTALGFIPHVALMAGGLTAGAGLPPVSLWPVPAWGLSSSHPWSAWLIAPYGWRQSYLIYAVLILGCSYPLSSWCIAAARKTSGSIQMASQASASRTPDIPSPRGSGRYAIYCGAHHAGFWALFGVIFAIACTVMLLTVHQNQYLVDIGFSPAFAAWMLGLSGLLRSGGSILWGALSDRMTRETSFTLSTLLGVVGLLCLLSADLARCLARGGVRAAHGAGLWRFQRHLQHCGSRSLSGAAFRKILGLMEIGFGLGASLGSAIAGVVFDYFQTYRPAFYLTIGLMLASIVGIWIAAPRAARRTVEAMASAPAPRPAR